MKQVPPLSTADKDSLETTYRHSSNHRLWQRAQAVLLSARGYSLDQLADILQSDRDTLSRWLDQWQEKGVAGLSDAPRAGRPSKIDAGVEEALREILEHPSPNLKAAVVAELEKRAEDQLGYDTQGTVAVGLFVPAGTACPSPEPRTGAPGASRAYPVTVPEVGRGRPVPDSVRG